MAHTMPNIMMSSMPSLPASPLSARGIDESISGDARLVCLSELPRNPSLVSDLPYCHDLRMSLTDWAVSFGPPAALPNCTETC